VLQRGFWRVYIDSSNTIFIITNSQNKNINHLFIILYENTLK
jgi:hypothetical protein